MKHLIIIPCVALAFAGMASNAQAALAIGAFGIVGYVDNGAPDSLTLVALEPIAAGEQVYFTDNGWTASGFRGASATDGDGNENLLKLTFNSDAPAGTILSSAGSNPAVSWTTSGAIPGTTSGAYANLSLSSTGDQITAFQTTSGTNPLLNAETFVFVIDSTNGFEDATSSSTGNIPPDLSLASFTAVTLPATFQGNSFAIDTSSPAFAALNTSGGTKAQWLSLIADPNNWAAVSQPTGTWNVTTVPEPTAAALALGAAGLLIQRRRKS